MFKVQRHHLIGLFVGGLLGAAVAGLGGVFGYALSLGDGLFWGALTGSVLSSVPQFAQSGAVLTRRKNPILNTVVGILGGLMLLGVVIGLVMLVNQLFS